MTRFTKLHPNFRKPAGRALAPAVVAIATLGLMAMSLSAGCGGNDRTTNPGGGPPPGGGGRSNAIDIVVGAQSKDMMAFSPNPDTIRISINPTITWTNRDGITHTVTSSNGAFVSSGFIAPSGTYSALFGAPGTYSYL